MAIRNCTRTTNNSCYLQLARSADVAGHVQSLSHGRALRFRRFRCIQRRRSHDRKDKSRKDVEMRCSKSIIPQLMEAAEMLLYRNGSPEADSPNGIRRIGWDAHSTRLLEMPRLHEPL